ncbi:polysaccharide deacetylase family sporulation protein PdaB [Clostridium pascui]|uniref:polysaccharide deacetylase family sporulation protein PdaB n=1 Tax=Clostridium pascui TaxID=46609 RepID=UPI001956F385|nr:polysaccharide deacetylase family sporulation protein PdaB [Clostridium pascui]MBM7870044.1 polysaccharide deacetylase family sporulation protein PdaB [Clostridium pascui]
MKSKIYKKVLFAVLLLAVSTISSIFLNVSKGVFIQDKNIPIYSVDTQEKKVSITFDVNWGNDNTIEILDILDKYNVKATFFIIGNWAEDFPELTKEIYKRGHEIGNHSDTHPDFTQVSKDRIIKEISVADAKIMKITGQGTKLFRCPSGSYNDNALNAVKSAGYNCIQWDVDSIDWKAEGADIEYERVMKKVNAGSIILFHSDAKFTPYNLPRIIENLKANGYSFVKVGDLIYKENYKINLEGKQILIDGK